jgi:hypothetical protein
MKIKLTETQMRTLLNELTLGHENGYALIDGKPYKIKKSPITVNVDNLTQNKDGSASLSWSVSFLKKSGNELISKNSVDKIVNDIKTKGESEMSTKMGTVNIIPK